MYTIDDCCDYTAFTAATAKGASTCCDAEITYRDDLRVEVCVECEATVVATVPN
jgi:hypothetical protein